MANWDRWCPLCGVWVPENKQRVRGDGLRRHAECDTVTTPTKTTAGEHIAVPTNGDSKGARKCTCEKGWDHFEVSSETKDLAERMAADEANEGNYAAAAGLQALMPTMSPGPGQGAELQSYVDSNGLRYRGDPDAPIGPLTPGQVACRVCRLDDRTRAATDPVDLQCDVCRADEPNRIQRQKLEALRVALEDLFGMTERLRDDETTAGVAERELICERVGAVMKMAALADGHMLPEELVKAAELGVREMEVRVHPRVVIFGAEGTEDEADRG